MTESSAYEIEACATAEVRSWLDAVEACPFLSEMEKAACLKLKTRKRRLDWLAGRLAAKRLIQRRLLRDDVRDRSERWNASEGVVEAQSRNRTPLADIQILSAESGMPQVVVPEGPSHRHRISISHSQGAAICVLSRPGTRIGADLETIEPRDVAWTRVAFHPSEMEDGGAETNLWTVKEAVLKFLGVGLSVDLWDVRRAPDSGRLELRGGALRAWEKLGRPPIAVDTMPYAGAQVLSVAYTPYE